jgi:hypothetical protein
MFSSASSLEGAESVEGITREAVERLKSEVPDLCMWVYAAKGINEGTGLPDTHENTVSTMQLIVEMLSSEDKEDLRPSAAQRRGWDAGMLAKRRDTGEILEEVGATVAKIRASVATLNEASEQLDIAKTLVEFKYQETFAQLEQISHAVLAGGYKAPGEADKLMADMYRQVEATGEQRRLLKRSAAEIEEEESSDSGSDTSSSGSYYSSSEDEENRVNIWSSPSDM